MIAVYPGTFDPVTNGHVDIIERASSITEHLFVAILNNLAKRSLFTVEERAEHIRAASAHLNNVEVLSFYGLQVDLARELGAMAIIRGLRGVSDLSHELMMASGNRLMDSGVETLFIPANPTHSFISSSLVKEIATFGGNVAGMVPCFMQEELKRKINGSV